MNYIDHIIIIGYHYRYHQHAPICAKHCCTSQGLLNVNYQDNPLSFGELYLTVVGACYHPRGSFINKDVISHLHCVHYEVLFNHSC